MTIDELNKKVERLFMITVAKRNPLECHSKFLNQAFAALRELTKRKPDVIHEKLQGQSNGMDINMLPN